MSFETGSVEAPKAPFDFERVLWFADDFREFTKDARDRYDQPQSRDYHLLDQADQIIMSRLAVEVSTVEKVGALGLSRWYALGLYGAAVGAMSQGINGEGIILRSLELGYFKQAERPYVREICQRLTAIKTEYKDRSGEPYNGELSYQIEHIKGLGELIDGEHVAFFCSSVGYTATEDPKIAKQYKEEARKAYTRASEVMYIE